MLYNAYELQRTMLSGAASWASITSEALSNPALGAGYFGMGTVMASALDVFAHAAAPRGKPAFGIETITVDGTAHSVTQSTVLHKPFANLLRFSHEGLADDAPRLLIVAPMSGHYATLLRGTVARMLERAVVYVTDWADAKMVPLEAGHFDLDDYIDYIIDFFDFIGPGTHALAVCQPSVPTLAATAVMAGDGNPNRPATLTMMGGPID
ncbi:MAG: polyhydroxyalkanoate depolymerase, partial [Sphingomonadaceae bacterium]|nr:polyhydroxyalkanoate depolymerase [Sphingomonadaceae bacterium]